MTYIGLLIEIALLAAIVLVLSHDRVVARWAFGIMVAAGLGVIWLIWSTGQ